MNIKRCLGRGVKIMTSPNRVWSSEHLFVDPSQTESRNSVWRGGQPRIRGLNPLSPNRSSWICSSNGDPDASDVGAALPLPPPPENPRNRGSGPATLWRLPDVNCWNRLTLRVSPERLRSVSVALLRRFQSLKLQFLMFRLRVRHSGMLSWLWMQLI